MAEIVPDSQQAQTPTSYDEVAEHQLELFESRLPKRPYCTDDLETGLLIRDPKRACRARYIQANSPWLRCWLLFDVDHETSGGRPPALQLLGHQNDPSGALAWEDAGLPEPSWTTVSPETGNAHLSYGLDAPVLMGQHDRAHPMRYLAAVEEAMAKKLRSDDGYSGLITKNPKHSHWRVLWGRRLYTLGELEEWLELPKFVKKKSDPERYGVGRNVSTFDHVRYQAYPAVRSWKLAGQGAYVYWQQWLYQVALHYTHNEHKTPLDSRECHWIAKSVAHWVWTRFDVDASDARFSALQAHRGRQGKGKSGRKRQYASAAERQRAYRRRQRYEKP